MSITVVNPAGAKQSTTLKVEAPKVSESALALALRATLANDDRQRPLVKTRGEVRGGGRKPWRQKGTGRARAGSRRSPVWRHGGITFGPSGLPRAIKLVNRKQRKAALLAALAQRADAGTVIVISATPKAAKTKEAAAFFGKFGDPVSTLFVAGLDEQDSVLGVNNLGDVTATTTADLSLVDLVRHQRIVLTKTAWDVVTGAAKPAVKEKAPAKPAAKAPASKATPKKPAAKKEAK